MNKIYMWILKIWFLNKICEFWKFDFWRKYVNFENLIFEQNMWILKIWFLKKICEFWKFDFWTKYVNFDNLIFEQNMWILTIWFLNKICEFILNEQLNGGWKLWFTLYWK